MWEGQTGVHEAGGHRSILHHASAPAEFNKTQNKSHGSPPQATLGVPRVGNDRCVTVPVRQREACGRRRHCLAPNAKCA